MKKKKEVERTGGEKKTKSKEKIGRGEKRRGRFIRKWERRKTIVKKVLQKEEESKGRERRRNRGGGKKEEEQKAEMTESEVRHEQT